METHGKYDDIIHLARPQSDRHPPMSMHDRAAQFSPFAALTGHGAAIYETARLTERRRERDEETRSRLTAQLHFLSEHPDSGTDVTFTCFRPDSRKAGGRYVSITGKVREIEPVLRIVTLTDATKISFDDIYKIDSARFDDEAFE